MNFPKATTNITNTTTKEGLLSPFATGMILELVGITDSLGNLMVIVAVALCKSWIITDVLLLSLSMADFLDAFVALHMVIFIKYFKITSWSRISCDAFVALLYTFRMASATTVTLIAIERAFILVFPLKHHTMVTLTKIKRSVTAVWIFAFICSILPFIGVGNSGFQNHECYFQLYELGESYTIFFEVIGLFMLALVLSCYIAVKNAGRKFIKRQSTFTPSTKFQIAQPEKTLSTTQAVGGPRHEKPKGTAVGAARRVPRGGVGRPERRDSRGVQSVRKVSAMMGVVVLVYYFSWLPFLLSNLASLITGHNPKPSVTLFTGLISFMHALVNPVLYGKMSPRYRKAYIFAIRRLFALCGGKAPVRRDSTRGLSRLNSAGDLNLSQTTSRSSIPNANTTAPPPEGKNNQHLKHSILLNSNANSGTSCQEGEEKLFNKERRVEESNRLEYLQSLITNTSVGTNSLGPDTKQVHDHNLPRNTSTDITNKPADSGDGDVTVPDRPNGDVTVSEELQSSEERADGECTHNSSERTVSIKNESALIVLGQTDGEEVFLENKYLCPDSGQLMGPADTFIKQPPSSLGMLVSNGSDTTDEVESCSSTQECSHASSDKPSAGIALAHREVPVPTNIEKFASNLTFEILKDLI